MITAAAIAMYNPKEVGAPGGGTDDGDGETMGDAPDAGPTAIPVTAVEAPYEDVPSNDAVIVYVPCFVGVHEVT